MGRDGLDVFIEYVGLYYILLFLIIVLVDRDGYVFLNVIGLFIKSDINNNEKYNNVEVDFDRNRGVFVFFRVFFIYFDYYNIFF